MAGTSILPTGVISSASAPAPISQSHSSRRLSHFPNRYFNWRNNGDQFIPGSCRSSRFCFRGPRKAGSVKITAMAASFGSRMVESVKKTIGDNLVVVYSKTWCSYSSEVKSLFRRLGVEPLVIELDQLGPQGPQLQKVLERITGQHTVPNVFIGGKHIGGCTDTVKLYRKGELEPLLLDIGAKKTES